MFNDVPGEARGEADLRQRYLEVGNAPGDLGTMLRRSAQATPDRTFVVIEGEALTFAALDSKATDQAKGLIERGVKPGDRVAFFCGSSIRMVELMFACWRAGAIIVPLNAFLKGDPLRHQLADSGASMVVMDAEGAATVDPILVETPAVNHVVLLEQADLLSSIDQSGYEELGRPSTLDAELPVQRVDEPAALIYTSGTTGLPKACVLSHRYFHHLGRQCIATFDLADDDVFYSVSPLYHLTSFIPLMAALLASIPIHFDRKFSGTSFLDRCRAIGATVLLGVGFYAVGLLRRPPSLLDKEHNLRLMMLAPLAEADRRAFEERFGVPLLTQTYGQTEMSSVTVNLVHDMKDGTAGRANPWAEVAIVNDLDEELPVDEVGEIVLRPRFPGVMFDGYWNRDDASLKCRSNLWHHTGDLGRMDDDGYLVFVGRKSDSMRRRGENVSAFEVEQVIVKHAAVEDVAVHAVQIAGEVDDAIKACIVVTSGLELSPLDIASHVLDGLPHFAVPRFVEVVAELPRNASGRVLKHVLVKREPGEVLWDLEELGLLDRPRRT
ncbi:class I adenylate-forming enzyme family protein [Aeromicrobium sp. Leaf350]|uniref:class I adenylate-forming enzyme family protein n=1 Tax=Aeromicrobium sp. Leaf350 TaxID=2876565 RepID=UPI001E4FF3FD|nr:AMP-binding protein [Aeromicrobium sp. Leaf350]